MGEPDLLLNAARALRGELPRLDLDHAEGLDDELAELIAAVVKDYRALEDLAALLDSRPETKSFADHFLREGVPPGVRVYRRKAIAPLPGRPRRISATRWSCPSGDFDFFQRSRQERVPPCPTHRIPLVREDPGVKP